MHIYLTSIGLYEKVKNNVMMLNIRSSGNHTTSFSCLKYFNT